MPEQPTLGLDVQPARHTEIACMGCTPRRKREGGPSHTPSARCESGKRPHCSCDTCF